MKLCSFNFTYAVVMKCFIQSMNFFTYIAHIAFLVLSLSFVVFNSGVVDSCKHFKLFGNNLV